MSGCRIIRRQPGSGRSFCNPAMYARGQSDGVVLPKNVPNKGSAPGDREGLGGGAGGKDPGQEESE